MASTSSSTEAESSGYCAGDSQSVDELEQDHASVTASNPSVLKAPTPSDIYLKRKVATIPARNRCT